MLAGLVAALASAALFGLGAVAQAHGVRGFVRRPGSLLGFVRESLGSAWMMLVVAAYLLGWLLHAVAIWLLPLYLAQAAISVSLPVTAVTSAVLLREPLGARRWVAVAAVSAGIVLLALGAGPVGDPGRRGLLAVGAWVGVLGVLLAGRRFLGAGSGVLGAISGVGYAGSAVATRGLSPDLSPAVLALAAAVPAFGLLAFWTYSVALDRGEVATASGPLIVGQTFLPALVGVALLADRVRPGWWPVVLAGLVLATAGAADLARRGPPVVRRRSPGPLGPTSGATGR